VLESCCQAHEMGAIWCERLLAAASENGWAGFTMLMFFIMGSTGRGPWPRSGAIDRSAADVEHAVDSSTLRVPVLHTWAGALRVALLASTPKGAEIVHDQHACLRDDRLRRRYGLRTVPEQPGSRQADNWQLDLTIA
jgi:hypothetical protein